MAFWNHSQPRVFPEFFVRKFVHDIFVWGKKKTPYKDANGGGKLRICFFCCWKNRDPHAVDIEWCGDDGMARICILEISRWLENSKASYHGLLLYFKRPEKITSYFNPSSSKSLDKDEKKNYFEKIWSYCGPNRSNWPQWSISPVSLIHRHLLLLLPVANMSCCFSGSWVPWRVFLKNMRVKMDHFPYFPSENSQNIQTTTT